MEVHESRDVARNLKNHVATIAAVRAVGASERLKLFALNRGAAVATITAGDVENGAVNEGCHGGLSTQAEAPWR